MTTDTITTTAIVVVAVFVVAKVVVGWWQDWRYNGTCDECQAEDAFLGRVDLAVKLALDEWVDQHGRAAEAEELARVNAALDDVLGPNAA